MTGGAPKIYNIPPGIPFVDALARGLLRGSLGDPLELARTTVLLPTRRACRALQEAFLRGSEGRALLLPRLLPLGDVDVEELILAGEESILGASAAADLPPAIPPLRRQLLLSRLILQWGKVRGARPNEDQAVRLAAELSRLLDQVETEGLDFGRLEALVPDAYAHHWQLTLGFLGLLTERWPDIQAAEGCIGPAERRRRLLEAQARIWRLAPPPDPVIAAGSTGSIPATAELLGVVGRLPQGMVILPGLDDLADEDAWEAIKETPTHPQNGLAVLLDRLGVARDQVRPWPGPWLDSRLEGGVSETPRPRAVLVNMALRPAEMTPDWLSFADAADRKSFRRALSGVTRIDCPGPGEEAVVIALLLRRALADPACRAALVTPDRALARRVAAELGRWEIGVDDSAGVPLGDTPPGAFLRLTAEMAAGDLAPLEFLALLKHPLASGGRRPGEFRALVRALERAVLRGPRPAPGFAGMKRALRAAKEAPKGLSAWLSELDAMARPFLRALRRAAPLAKIVEAHIEFAEALTATPESGGTERLWAGEAGAEAADFVADLRAAADGAPPLPGTRYPSVFSALMAGRVVRPRYGGHPRLSIWGPLEARLQHADVLVLGALNEGAWPASVDSGPWLSRPMCGDFGLPLPERRIGLSAHDFAQCLGAPRVYLTRATRVEGTPTLPSRWLLRLEALLVAMGLDDALADQEQPWLAWAEALDRPARARHIAPPAPCPPLEARPRRLSVTRVETWMRDPYDLYAREILRLRPLEPIDADPGAAQLGTLVHEVLERFLAKFPDRLPVDPETALVKIGAAVFGRDATRPGVHAFWWPRFRRIARWFVGVEGVRRAALDRSYPECRGVLNLEAPGGSFELSAKADRIDLWTDGTLTILDYKTGMVPTETEVKLGFSPQLPLEAAIAGRGGFARIPAAPVAQLEYWRVSGGDPAGEIKPLKSDPGDAAEAALQGLRRLITEFDDPETPYRSRPRPEWAGRFSDYAHLARIKEWAVGDFAEDIE